MVLTVGLYLFFPLAVQKHKKSAPCSAPSDRPSYPGSQKVVQKQSGGTNLIQWKPTFPSFLGVISPIFLWIQIFIFHGFGGPMIFHSRALKIIQPPKKGEIAWKTTIGFCHVFLDDGAGCPTPSSLDGSNLRWSTNQKRISFRGIYFATSDGKLVCSVLANFGLNGVLAFLLSVPWASFLVASSGKRSNKRP